MKSNIIEKLKAIYRDKKYRKTLHRIFFSLSAIVVFITSYFLILPAITVEKDKVDEKNIEIEEPLVGEQEEKPKYIKELDPAYIELKELLEKYEKILDQTLVSDEIEEKIESGKTYYNSQDFDDFRKKVLATKDFLEKAKIDQTNIVLELEKLKEARDKFEATRKIGTRPPEDKEAQEDGTQESEDEPDPENEPEKEDQVKEELELEGIKNKISELEEMIEQVKVSDDKVDQVEKGQVYYSHESLFKFKIEISKAKNLIKRENISQEDVNLALQDLVLAEENFISSRLEGTKEDSQSAIQDLYALIKEGRDIISTVKILEEKEENVDIDQDYYNQVDIDIFSQVLDDIEKDLKESILSLQDIEKQITRLKLEKETFEASKKTGKKEKETLKASLKIENKEGPILTEIELLNTKLGENINLEVKPIRKNPTVGLKTVLSNKMSKKDKINNTYDRYRKALEVKFGEGIEDLRLYDISFYSEDGEYLKVEDQARVNLSMLGQNLTQEEASQIRVVHFKEDLGQILEAIELEADIELQGQEVSQISFETEGFSVFAVIKLGSWTEVQLQEDEYTIISSVDETYKTAKILSNSLGGQDLDKKHIIRGPLTGAIEKYFQFRDLEVRNNYNRFLIIKNGANRYSILDQETDLYLAIYEDGSVGYQLDAFEFKFYKNRYKPDHVMILAAETTNKKPQVLVYDKATNTYKAINSYKIEEGKEYPYHQFLKNQREEAYEKLSESELLNLKDGQYAIIAYMGGRSLNNKTVPPEFPRTSSRHLDSIDLKEEGGYYYSTIDSARGDRKIEPHIWTISKAGNNQYFIQDQEGSYLTIVDAGIIDNGYLELVDQGSLAPNELEGDRFRFSISHHQDGTIKLTHLANHMYNRKLSINIDLNKSRTNWHAWRNANVTNNYLYLARKSNKPIKDTVHSNQEQEPDLVEAIVPEGDYYIADKDGNFALENNREDNYLSSDRSRDENNELKAINGSNLTNRNVFNIKRESDGTYRITRYGKPVDFLQITNIVYNNYEYRKIYLKDQIVEADSQKIKIATTDNDPSLLYIYTDFGSLQFYPWGNYPDFGASKEIGLGTPLRLYRIIDNNKNKRFIHQEKEPTEKLANIPDGAYVIGNNPSIHKNFINPDDAQHEKFINKQTFITLQANAGMGQAWIHYNEKSELDNEEYHMIEKKEDFTTDLSQWTFTQTDQPGYYFLSGSMGSLALPDGGPILTSTNVKPLNIYKREGVNDQILITQGNNRLRFDGNSWVVVPNSEPLTEADYHYLGKKVDNYLHFEVTNPESGNSNKWLNNVRVMETVWVNNLLENGQGRFEKNQPKGFYQEIGPIGEIYKYQHPGENNPYKNLYRMSQDLTNIPSQLHQKHFKEYDFIAWETEKGGKIYLVKKDASFTETVKNENGESQKGILIKKDQAYQLANGESTPVNQDLFFPYGQKFKTHWKELSAPLYFYVNYGKGLMDVERGIQVDELLARETSVVSSPIIASGRLFYAGNMKSSNLNGNLNPEIKLLNSGISMDHKIRANYRVKVSLNFAEDHFKNWDEKIKNQIYIDKLATVPAPGNILVSNVELKARNFPISNQLLHKNTIDWIRESNHVLSILKKSIDGGADIDFQVDKENIINENYDFDYLWIDRRANGSFLQAIVYGKTSELVVEKKFRNLSQEDVLAMRTQHETSYGLIDRFHIDIKVDYKRKKEGSTEERQYDDTLFTLAFDRTSSGNVTASPYPRVGEPPVSYSEIERVTTEFDGRDNVRWIIGALAGELYKLEEKGVDRKTYSDGTQDRQLYIRIEQYSNIADTPEEIKQFFNYGSQDMANIKTKILNTSVNNYVKFNNLYTSGGVILLVKTDKDTGQPLKGIKFDLYKIENGQEIHQNSEQNKTTENGTIAFRDLKEGDYVLKESPDPGAIYKPIDDYNFSIERVVEGENTYYRITNFTNTDSVNCEPSSITNGEIAPNVMKVLNTTEVKILTIEKNFVNLKYTEYKKVLENFKIRLEGTKNGKKYSTILTPENANVSTYTKKIIWRINKLKAEDESTLSPLDMDHIAITEEGYSHENYPVVKRDAWFNGVKRDFLEYPYKLNNGDFRTGENPNNIFKLNNTYTDTFALVLDIRGRDKEFINYRQIEDMGFHIFGSVDEASSGSQGQNIPGFGTYYILDKPDQDGGAPTRNFLTDDKGVTRIFNLAYYEGNEYLIMQYQNPGDSPANPGVIYYPINKAFHIKLTRVNNKVEPKAEINDSVKGIMTQEYQNGLLIIRLKLDRTNYRLPETGGIGRDLLQKVALGLIMMAVAFLIYRRKK